MAQYHNNYCIKDKEKGIRSDDPYATFVPLHLQETAMYKWRGLIQVTLPSAPPQGSPNAEIYEIQLRLCEHAGYSEGSPDTAIHLLNHNDWDSTHVSWMRCGVGSYWDTPGGDYNPTPIDVCPYGTPSWKILYVVGSNSQNPISWTWGETKSFIFINNTPGSYLETQAGCAAWYVQVAIKYQDVVTEVRSDTKIIVTNPIDTTHSNEIRSDTLLRVEGPNFTTFRSDTKLVVVAPRTIRSDVLLRPRTPFFLERMKNDLPRFVIMNDLLEEGVLKPIAEAMDEFRAYADSLPTYIFGD